MKSLIQKFAATALTGLLVIQAQGQNIIELGIFNTGDNKTYEVRARPVNDFSGDLQTAWVTVSIPSSAGVPVFTNINLGNWAVAETKSSAGYTSFLLFTVNGNEVSWAAGSENAILRVTLPNPANNQVLLGDESDPAYVAFAEGTNGAGSVAAMQADGFYASDLLLDGWESQVDRYYSSNAPLPVVLSHFSAASEGQLSNLSWATTSESNSSHFEIQHSIDAKRWAEIGRVKSKGNSNSLRHYSYTHETPSAGINYYRMKMIDLDGSFELSSIKSLEFSRPTKTEVFPNPATGMFSIRSDNWEQVTDITLYNSVGVAAYQSGGKPEKEIKTDHFLPGMYILKINRTDGKNEALRIVIAR